MSRRHRVVVPVLATAALVVGWPNIRESSLGLSLTGRCDHRGGRGRRAGCAEDPYRREERRRGEP